MRSADIGDTEQGSPFVHYRSSPMTDLAAAKKHRLAPLTTPTPLGTDATRDISAELNALLADTFALYFKTKNFHWHMSGPSFRDYHLMLDEQSDQIFATDDPMAERVRKLGGTTLLGLARLHLQARAEVLVDAAQLLRGAGVVVLAARHARHFAQRRFVELHVDRHALGRGGAPFTVPSPTT
jgi:hypothetical protein